MRFTASHTGVSAGRAAALPTETGQDTMKNSELFTIALEELDTFNLNLSKAQSIKLVKKLRKKMELEQQRLEAIKDRTPTEVRLIPHSDPTGELAVRNVIRAELAQVAA